MHWNLSMIWALAPLAAVLEWRIQAVQSLATKLVLAPVRRPVTTVAEGRNARRVRAD